MSFASSSCFWVSALTFLNDGPWSRHSNWPLSLPPRLLLVHVYHCKREGDFMWVGMLTNFLTILKEGTVIFPPQFQPGQVSSMPICRWKERIKKHSLWQASHFSAGTPQEGRRPKNFGEQLSPLCHNPQHCEMFPRDKRNVNVIIKNPLLWKVNLWCQVLFSGTRYVSYRSGESLTWEAQCLDCFQYTKWWWGLTITYMV